MGSVLAFDLGTTFFKAALVSERGRILAMSRTPAPHSEPVPGRVEIGPSAFHHSLVRLADDVRVRSDDGFDGVDAVTCCSQANSFLLLDEADVPSTPIVLWLDNRAEKEVGFIDRFNRIPFLAECTGVPRITSQFAVAKLEWFRRHMPERLDGARCCFISDFLTNWLTGRHVCELSAAGLAALADIHTGEWCSGAIAETGFGNLLRSPLVRSGTDVGPLRHEAAAELGLPPGCRFITGCLDQYAAAIGVGCIEPGDIAESTGTVLATVRYSDAFRRGAAGDIFQGPAPARGDFFQMTFSQTSAGLLDWLRGTLPGEPSIESLLELADQSPPGARGLVWAGIDRSISANSFAGWTANHSTGDAVRCILETVAHALADQVRLLGGDHPPAIIRATGGGARSPLWLDIKTRVLGRPVVGGQIEEPACYGVAALAASVVQSRPLADVCRDWMTADNQP